MDLATLDAAQLDLNIRAGPDRPGWFPAVPVAERPDLDTGMLSGHLLGDGIDEDEEPSGF